MEHTVDQAFGFYIDFVGGFAKQRGISGGKRTSFENDNLVAQMCIIALYSFIIALVILSECDQTCHQHMSSVEELRVRLAALIKTKAELLLQLQGCSQHQIPSHQNKIHQQIQ